MKLEIHSNLEKLSEACAKYALASGKDEAEVLEKQGGKLAWNIYSGLRGIMPEKGAVRAERLVALKAGGGVKVRQSVYDEIAQKYDAVPLFEGPALFHRKGKLVGSTAAGLNLQALAVKRELSLRESARGFSAYSDPRPPRSYAQQAAREINDDITILSRYGFLLSEFQIHTTSSAESKYIAMRWKPSKGEYESAVSGLSTEQQQKILDAAITETRNDIEVYIRRKQKETIEKYFGS